MGEEIKISQEQIEQIINSVNSHTSESLNKLNSFESCFDNTGVLFKFSKLNRRIINLRKIAVLGAEGGTVFDYFIDKGIKKVNLYSANYVYDLATLVEQGTVLNLEVNAYSNFSVQVPLTSTERIKTPYYINDINTIDNEELNTPFITIGVSHSKLKNSAKYTFTDLFNYSRMKQFLLDKVLDKINSTNNKQKIIIFAFPPVESIKNPDEYEEKLKLNKLLPEDKYKRHLDSHYKVGYTNESELKKISVSFSTKKEGSVHLVNDMSTEHLNCVGGYRLTTNQPLKSDKTIYTFGFSTCFGQWCCDEYTLQSVLQRELNTYFGEQENQYSVLNCANGGIPNYHRQWNSFDFHNPQDNDITIFVCRECGYELIYENYKDKFIFIRPHSEVGMFDRPHNYGDIYTNDIHHFTPTGYKVMGEYLAKRMIELGVFEEKQDSNETQKQQTSIQNNTSVSGNPALTEYINSIKPNCPKIGSIVMNCNPFTLGHRYLIEESTKKVSQLIIFVVEEDKSFFPFKDRLELVKQGTKDLKNVTVVPSGGFIISQQTFGAYFEKGSIQEQKIDPTNDVTIFAEQIAPKLA
jgi:[citrate (pro-3S)-lyase] ligase